MVDPKNIKKGDSFWCYRKSLGGQKHVVKRAECFHTWRELPFLFDFGVNGKKHLCFHVFSTELEARTHQTSVMLRELLEAQEALNIAADEYERCQQATETPAMPAVEWPKCTCSGPRSNPANCEVCGAGESNANN